ncbi:MAG: PSD1 and planctomycete cytochrome C domain-containing protein [Planctomycetes bacterium]|nr:PSD1 and planctomycete cytochrome C domain-containing protein [Planctomycetota bacterium]
MAHVMRTLLALASLLAWGSGLAAAEPDRQGLEFFESKIRPVLVEKCYACHSAEAAADGKLKGNLLLDTRDGARSGGDSGPAVVPGNVDESLLVSALRHESFEMPPTGKLPDAVIADFVKWVEIGAPDPREGDSAPVAGTIDLEAGRRFWSFQPFRRTDPPAVKDESWVRTPIDRFLLARQEQLGLHANPTADRRTLIRRAYFDLLGLPPTPAEVEAFINDADPQAYEKLIDRLLQSPHYGERWARHWLDVARFAESHGYEQDYDRPHAYHYRDFVIQALNADMPYDQFVRWQLAGDELAPEDPLAMMATGFLGAGPFPTQLTEAEFESARYDELDDMTATTGVAFLGLSIGCARCHDHKFDPIPTKDYYRFASTFTTTIRSEIELELGEGETKVQVSSEGLPHIKHHADDRGYPHFYPETHFLVRGDVHRKDGVAEPGFLQVLMPEEKDASHWRVAPPNDEARASFRRASLANWITDTEYGAGHLAARVAVNRLWQHHFGRGIVATPNDFGTQGEHPTHPELLDWLASDLVQHGWKLKRLHKVMMTSSVYMQSSDFDEARARLDRENAFHWRRAPQRLEAEAIRDAMLHVAGMLDTTMFGPGTLDQNMRRRSVYFFIKRSQLIPMMMLFDWPEHLVSIGARSVTTIAPQSLMFMNSPQARQYAEGFAGRLEDKSREGAVHQAYRLALAREPTERERQVAAEFLAAQQERHQQAGHADAERLALIDFCQAMLSLNEFVYVE